VKSSGLIGDVAESEDSNASHQFHTVLSLQEGLVAAATSCSVPPIAAQSFLVRN
jgi:hypothetical protein